MPNYSSLPTRSPDLYKDKTTAMEPGLPIVCFIWALTALSGAIVIARGIMKIIRFHGLAWEDYLMIVSLVSNLLNLRQRYYPCTDCQNHRSLQSSTDHQPHYYTLLTLRNTPPSAPPSSQNTSTSVMPSDSWPHCSAASRSVSICCGS
jgi:hypothetical protein